MKLARLWTHQDGASAVEFALAAPAFVAVLFGIIEGGLLLWTQFGLQHSVERAARCASINKTLCATVSDIQNYAMQQSLSVNPPPSAFSVATVACGNQITATYLFQSTVTLTAQACFPN